MKHLFYWIGVGAVIDWRRHAQFSIIAALLGKWRFQQGVRPRLHSFDNVREALNLTVNWNIFIDGQASIFQVPKENIRPRISSPVGVIKISLYQNPVARHICVNQGSLPKISIGFKDMEQLHFHGFILKSVFIVHGYDVKRFGVLRQDILHDRVFSCNLFLEEINIVLVRNHRQPLRNSCT